MSLEQVELLKYQVDCLIFTAFIGGIFVGMIIKGGMRK